MKRLYGFVLAVGLVAAGISQHLYAQEWDPPNDPVLQEAIQTVQNFLGDPSITPIYITEEDTSFDMLMGPGRFFKFEVPGYSVITVRVDVTPMQVVGWIKDKGVWIPSLDRSRPPLSTGQMVQIAEQYARAHWPYWNEFPLKMIQHTTSRRALWNPDTQRFDKDEVTCLVVAFRPYFVNSSGIKLPYEAAYCIVTVEPYGGTVVAFNWRRSVPMTLSQDQLNPTIPPSQAESIGEKAYYDYIRQILAQEGLSSLAENLTVDIQMDPTRDITHYDDSWWPERLVIGATTTGELKLAYVFDEVLVKDATTGEVLFEDFIAMDANTGEILWTHGPMSFGELPPQNQWQLLRNSVIGAIPWWVYTVGFVLLSVFLAALLILQKRRLSDASAMGKVSKR